MASTKRAMIKVMRLPGNKAYEYDKDSVWEKIYNENFFLFQQYHTVCVSTYSLRVFPYLYDFLYQKTGQQIELIIDCPKLDSAYTQDFQYAISKLDETTPKITKIGIIGPKSRDKEALRWRVQELTSIKQIDYIPLSRIESERLQLPGDVKLRTGESKKRKRGADNNVESTNDTHTSRERIGFSDNNNDFTEENNTPVQYNSASLDPSLLRQYIAWRRLYDELKEQLDVLSLQRDSVQLSTEGTPYSFFAVAPSQEDSPERVLDRMIYESCNRERESSERNTR